MSPEDLASQLRRSRVQGCSCHLLAVSHSGLGPGCGPSWCSCEGVGYDSTADGLHNQCKCCHHSVAIAASFWDALRLKNVVVDHLEQAAQATRLPRLMGPRGCRSYEPLPGCWAQSQPLAERVVGITLHGQAPAQKESPLSHPQPLTPGPCPPTSHTPTPRLPGLQRAT